MEPYKSEVNDTYDERMIDVLVAIVNELKKLNERFESWTYEDCLSTFEQNLNMRKQ